MRLYHVCLALVIAPIHGDKLMAQTPHERANPADLAFSGTEYFHRFTQSDQREYTPDGQEDLNRWTDMVTLRVYRQAKDGDGLAAVANAVLANYKAAKAMVLKTSSVPRTKEIPAEHLIVALFPRPEFIEVAFARFRMYEGIGTAVIYSHRIYGKAAGNDMSAWLKANGANTEKRLMSWDAMPKPRPIAKP